MTTVERKSRFVQRDVLESMDARTVRKKIEKRFKRLEPALSKSMPLIRAKRTANTES
jgi:hypothetical protein